MIAACPASSIGAWPRRCAARRPPDPCRGPEAGPAAPGSTPRRLGRALQDFLGDGVPPPAPARVADAARGFAAGDGYHTGGMVDRFI